MGEVYILVIIFCAAGAYITLRIKEDAKGAREKNERRASLIKEAVSNRLDVFRRRRNQLIRINDWGKEEDNGWEKEITYFTNEVFLNGLSEEDKLLFSEVPANGLALLFKLQVENELTAHPVAYTFQYFAGMDPITYELYCAERLKAAGWNVRTTKASGDQGVDVIAEEKGQRLVAQCKLYTDSVGNEAVQEIIAGRTFYDAHHAVVVSSANFTNSARQLAAKCNVALVHHDQLEDYGRKLLNSLRSVVEPSGVEAFR